MVEERRREMWEPRGDVRAGRARIARIDFTDENGLDASLFFIGIHHGYHLLRLPWATGSGCL